MSRATVFIHRDRLTPTARDKEQAARAAVTLAQLAQHVLDSSSEVPQRTISAIVRVCCPHIRDAGERMRLWAEYLAAVEQEAGLLDGPLTWQDIDDSLTCADKQTAAIDIAVERSREALEALTRRHEMERPA